MTRDQDGNLCNPKLRAIEERLAIVTCDLSRDELQYVWGLVQRLSARLTCERWGVDMGWEIPHYGTLEWDALVEAWLNKDDEDDTRLFSFSLGQAF